MLQRPLIQTVDTNFMGLCPAAVQIDSLGNPTFLVNRLTFPAADPFAQRFYLAHELGHAQGLPDIYAREVAGMPDVSGFASLERNPGDWGTSSSEGYYVSGFLQSEIVLRTLMNGLCSPVKRDLTTGGIHSIWKPAFSNEPYRESVAPVGFFDNAYPTPHSN